MTYIIDFFTAFVAVLEFITTCVFPLLAVAFVLWVVYSIVKEAP